MTNNQPLTPVSIEQRILEISNRIARSAAVCNDKYIEFLEADRNYDRAYALAFLRHDGPQTEKRYAAEEATYTEREARDVADAAYRYCDRLSKALTAELMAMQSVNKSVISQFNAAGVGER